MSAVSERAIETAKLILAKCAANDPWFPHPSESMLMAWAEQIMLTNLERDDLLAGVTYAYANHTTGFRPLPGDILLSARSIRADRSQRRLPVEREIHKNSPRKPSDQRDSAPRHNHPNQAPLGPLQATKAPKNLTPATQQQRAAAINLFTTHRNPPHIEETIPSPLLTSCPHCMAPTTHPCKIPGTNHQLKKTKYHPSRLIASKDNRKDKHAEP